MQFDWLLDASWPIVGLVVLVMYIWGVRKNRDRTAKAIRKSGRFVIKALPLFFLAVLLIGFMKIILLPNNQVILDAFGNADLGILWATLLGFLLPGPRYAIYPLAKEILVVGGSIGAVMALIASQQLIDVPEGCFIEIKYLGSWFFLARLVIAILTTFAAGYLAMIVNSFIPLWGP
ncbi:MAG: hypothetical protein EAX95_03390 [Candidatus Thorarchaeota archaeon]|nr:hypothetical protein [Candidatus Thorarchaeota archaeon]